jgi:hypothetical protein
MIAAGRLIERRQTEMGAGRTPILGSSASVASALYFIFMLYLFVRKKSMRKRAKETISYNEKKEE